MAPSIQDRSVYTELSIVLMPLAPSLEALIDGIDSDHHRIQFNASREFIDALDFSSFQTIADVGSGPGHQAMLFHLKGIKVTCIDFIPPLYPLPFVRPDATDGLQFDAIWSHHCLEHISNPIQALIAWRNLLRPGGRLFLTVPEVGLTMSSGHLNNFNLPQLIYILAVSGFDCSEKCFSRSRSHLRASVRKAQSYDPQEEGILTSLATLSQKGLFAPSIRHAISTRGRFSARDIHLNWFGTKKSPSSFCEDAYTFVTQNMWV